MNFTTKVPLAKFEKPIDYDSKILSLGSCFAENMGSKFGYFKFQGLVNPFGIIFNPASLENLIERVVEQRVFTEADVFLYNDLWHCFEVHSELSHPNMEALLRKLNTIIAETHLQISNFSHLQITYGTSWVYRNKVSQSIVANCHKVPQVQFDKEILSVATIEKSIQHTIDLIRKINPDCSFIFTISPVRHIKDGFTENQRSKAHLITAIHNIQNIHYFPSYEMMMDELRDYRFYAEDMLHPSLMAIDYIWEQFSKNYVSETCFPVMEEVDSIQKAIAHKPFNPDSEAHQKFLKNLQSKIEKLQQQYSHFTF